jgi:tellurite methyltransferase
MTGERVHHDDSRRERESATPPTPPTTPPTPPATPTTPLLPAHVYARERNWPKYFDTMANTPARPTLLKALELFDREGLMAGPVRALAIDLGCGEGRDTVELLTRGWQVLAIDSSPDGLARVASRARALGNNALTRLTTIDESFEQFGQPNQPEPAEPVQATLVNASFALPFCPPRAFAPLWRRIVASIRPGGRFAGQFFGDRDEWATLPDRTHHTRAQVLALLEAFDIEAFDEEERNPAASEPSVPGVFKRWHVFHVVARRRAGT